MLGTLRVIPGAGENSNRPQRIVTLRQIPKPEFLADLLGGEAHVVETFDSILHEGEAVPCWKALAPDFSMTVSSNNRP